MTHASRKTRGSSAMDRVRADAGITPGDLAAMAHAAPGDIVDMIADGKIAWCWRPPWARRRSEVIISPVFGIEIPARNAPDVGRMRDSVLWPRARKAGAVALGWVFAGRSVVVIGEVLRVPGLLRISIPEFALSAMQLGGGLVPGYCGRATPGMAWYALRREIWIRGDRADG